MKKTELSYDHLLQGIATFDLSGLPKEYFVLADTNLGIRWLQSIFQVIGLRSLLSASLALENFEYAIMNGVNFSILILRQQNDYLALLLEGDLSELNTQPAQIMTWAKSIDIDDFRQDTRYKPV